MLTWCLTCCSLSVCKQFILHSGQEMSVWVLHSMLLSPTLSCTGGPCEFSVTDESDGTMQIWWLQGELMYCTMVSMVWYCLVWCGMVWCGVVWCGVVWCGVVWCGVVWCGVVWCGVVWCGVVWCGVVWCGVVWCGVAWCGVVWCGVVWCGVVWCGVCGVV